MPSSNRARGRLPARVYWFRRILVLGTALALVFAFARLLNGGEDADKASAGANTVAAAPSTSPTVLPGGPRTPAATSTAKPRATATAPPPLAQADGPCAADEVTIKPVAGTAAAGQVVPLVLQLTSTRAACTFQVSPKSVVAKVSTRKGKVWSSQECPASISTSAVVVRSAAPTTIQVAWNGRASAGKCSRATAWALPGSYQVLAAAIGSEPSTAALKLTVPKRPVVIKTIQPKPTKKPKKGQSSSPVTPNTGP